MSGGASNNTDPGIGSTNNYDYLQHTTIHPQPNPPPQQHHAYYPQQQHDPASYAGNHHQHPYYHQQQPQINQQQYYQPPPQGELSQQQPPWPASNNVHNNQYHQAYYPQQNPQYHQNHNYHQQQHPPIHQLSSFVNHAAHNPQSPPPQTTGAMFPSAASSGYISQASPTPTPPPQRSLSPVRPGPGSSPGAASNHMMPVRLQNMAKGARTKAGMRKLMQMQEQHEQNASLQASAKASVPSSPKKPRLKKNGPTPPTTDHESFNSNASSVEESIESVVFSALPLQGGTTTTGNHYARSDSKSPIASLPRPDKTKTPPASLLKVKATAKIPAHSNTPKVIPNNPVLEPSSPFPSPRFTIENTDPFFHNPIPYVPKFKNPTPSDLLYEKLGLNKETSKKRGKGNKAATKDTPVKKRCNSANSVNSQISQSTDESHPEEQETPRRTRRNYSGSTDTTGPSIKSPSPKRSLSPKPKGKSVLSKSPETPMAKKRVSNVRKTKETTPKFVSPSTATGTTSEASSDEGSPIPKNRKRMTDTPKRLSRQNSKTPQKNLGAESIIVTSIAEVAAAIVQPTASIAAAKVSTANDTSTEVKPKRKYTKRNLTAPNTSPGGSTKKKVAGTAALEQKTAPLEVSVIPIHEPAARIKRKYTKSAPGAMASKKLMGKKQATAGVKLAKAVNPSSGSSVTPATPKSAKDSQADTKSGMGVLGSPSWIETVTEKRATDTMKMKKPTVWAKSSAGLTGNESKKEPGPSLKVKQGVVKFYRGSVEEDVDEALKKLEVVLKDNVTNVCDDDSPWVCIFCGLGAHDMRLGDLFGPYFVEESSGHNLRTKIESITKKEVWVHTDCALWAGDVILVGSTLRNLDEAVIEAGKVVCNICQNVGATIGCLKRGCKETAHFPCAKLNDWNLNGDTFHSHCKAHLAEAHSVRS